jgi:hypothetical protein
MYGLRSDQGKLDEWRVGERTSDVDIDPSFPEEPKKWSLPLKDLFVCAPTEPIKWITSGPDPEYSHLLYCDDVDEQAGPWVLLHGYIAESSPGDDRRMFTFLQAIFVQSDLVENLCRRFDEIDYPGNRAIPEMYDDHYTYAGEIPWSDQFATALRDPSGHPIPNRQDAFERYGGAQHQPGIPVEVPVHRFGWESYHSELNQVGGVVVPAPALCEHARLSNRRADSGRPEG